MTQEQIAQCQEAGNAAYDNEPDRPYDAYQAAYRAKLAEIVGACEREAERQAVDVEPHEFHGVPLADVLREDVCSEVDYPGMWQ